MTYILDYTVGGDGEMARGSVALRNDPMPGVGDTIRLSIRGCDTVVQVDEVRFGVANYGIQHINLDCSPRHNKLW
jgi:hypothetical protein